MKLNPILMKLVLVTANILVVAALFLLRGYAHGYQHAEADNVYQNLIDRGLIEETRMDAYAKANKGWHLRDRLQRIGHPDGFVQMFFVAALSMCLFNTLVVFFLPCVKPEPRQEPREGAASH